MPDNRARQYSARPCNTMGFTTATYDRTPGTRDFLPLRLSLVVLSVALGSPLGFLGRAPRPTLENPSTLEDFKAGTQMPKARIVSKSNRRPKGSGCFQGRFGGRSRSRGGYYSMRLSDMLDLPGGFCGDISENSMRGCISGQSVRSGKMWK